MYFWTFPWCVIIDYFCYGRKYVFLSSLSHLPEQADQAMVLIFLCYFMSGVDSYNRKKRHRPISKKFPYTTIEGIFSPTKNRAERFSHRFKFIKLKEANPFKFDVISYISTLPTEFKLQEYVDYEIQFQKTLSGPSI